MADLLTICIHTICFSYGLPYIARTPAMFLLAFFVFLRCSEFTATTSLRPKPSRLHCPPLQVYRRHHDLPLKTNQNKRIRPAETSLLLQIPIGAESFQSLDKLLVDQKISKRYFDGTFIHLRVRSSGHLFLVPKSPPPSPFFVRYTVSPIHYSGHSFRIGAATLASCNGVPEHLIQILGCWSSQTNHRYIRSDLKGLLSTQAILL